VSGCILLNEPPSASDWKALKSIYNSSFFCSLGFFVVSFLIPIIAYGYMNATATEVALVFSMLTLGSTIFSPVAGRIARGGKQRDTIGLGAISRAIAYIGMAFSVLILNKYVLILNSLLWGFGAAFYRVGSDAEISERVSQANRAEAFGKREAANGRGSVMGAFIGFSIIFWLQNLGIVVAFAAFAFSNLLGGAIVLRDKQPEVNRSISATNDVKGSMVVRGIGVLVMAAAIDAFIAALLSPFVELFIMSRFTVDIVQIALVYLPAGILSGVFGGPLGRFADHQNRIVIIAGGVFIGACSTIALVYIPSFLAWPMSLISITLLFSIGSITGLMAYTVVASVFGTAYQGRAGEGFGMFEAATGFSKFFAPLIGGVLWDLLDPSAPFILVGVSGFILIPIYIYGMKQFESTFSEKPERKNDAP
jgi:MFS family permease